MSSRPPAMVSSSPRYWLTMSASVHFRLCVEGRHAQAAQQIDHRRVIDRDDEATDVHIACSTAGVSPSVSKAAATWPESSAST